MRPDPPAGEMVADRLDDKRRHGDRPPTLQPADGPLDAREDGAVDTWACPACSADNSRDASVCVRCGRNATARLEVELQQQASFPRQRTTSFLLGAAISIGSFLIWFNSAASGLLVLGLVVGQAIVLRIALRRSNPALAVGWLLGGILAFLIFFFWLLGFGLSMTLGSVRPIPRR